MASDIRRLVAFWVSVLLLLVACSGDDAAGPVLDPAGGDPIEQIDAGSGGVVEAGPLSGLLTVQPSFGFGLYLIDPATGIAAAVPGIAAVESIDRNHDVVLQGDVAYSLGARVRDGQAFAADISLVRIGLSDGVVSQIAELGFDRETDDSSESVLHELVAVTKDHLLVRQSNFGQNDAVYRVFATSTGAEGESFAEPRFESSSDAGSCSGNVGHLIGLSDGRIAGVAVGSPAIIDVDSGDVDVLVPCDEPDAELGDHVSAPDIGRYVVVNESQALAADDVEQLLATELEPENGFVEADGDLWWVVAKTRTVNDVQAIVGGIVRFDLASQSVEAVFPIGEHLGAYTDCGADAEVCELQTLAQAQLRIVDNQLVIADNAENGKVLVLDPTSGDLRTISLELGAGVDYTTATLLAGDPNNAWVSVRRMTITSDDGDSRTAAGDTYIERIDLATATIDLSLAAEDIFF